MSENPPAFPVRCHRGFSLIEVVISLGIVAFALMAIFALFTNSLRSASETISQQEVLSVTRSLGDFLRSTNNGAGYETVLSWVASGTDPGLFAFIASDGSVTSGLKTTPKVTEASSSLSKRAGRLFRLVPILSPNAPSITGTSDLSANTFIPLQVKIYEVPSVETSTSNLWPVFTYETSVFR